MNASQPFAMVTLLGLDPATYQPHGVHGTGRIYPETNCYTDILVELVHARGDEPLAIVGSTLEIDFEGDQWTFFKPDPTDLRDLFGIDIHEMQPYLPLPDHLVEQLRNGRTMTVEVDAWHLPDTVATSYQREHVKTSVVVEGIDPAGEMLDYFHNGSLFRLEGADYRGALRVGVDRGSASLLPYCELIRFDERRKLGGDVVRATARQLVDVHLQRRPVSNPFEAFGRRLAVDLPALLDGDIRMYHDYAFATVRMAGAGFELAASHLEWVLGPAGSEAADGFRQIANGAKVLGFRLARQRPFDPGPLVSDLARAWDDAMRAAERATSARR